MILLKYPNKILSLLLLVAFMLINYISESSSKLEAFAQANDKVNLVSSIEPAVAEKNNLFGVAGSGPNGQMALGDLVMVDRLLAGGKKSLTEPKVDLGDLMILDRLFNGQDKSIFNSNDMTLGDLIVLNKLFVADGNFLSGKGILGDLIILNQLFNNKNGSIATPALSEPLGRLSF